MKIIEKIAITILMITIFLIILETKVQATTDRIQENDNYTLENEIQIRILPLMNSTKIGTITGEVKIVEVINDWCKIENDMQQGWIRINNIKSTNTEETVDEEPIQNEEQLVVDNVEQPEKEKKEPEITEEVAEENVVELNKIGYVDAEGLVIRKEPNTSSEALHSLSRNGKVTITGQIGKWYRIDYEGQEAYVSAKYISDTKSTETTSRGEISREESTENKVEDKKEEQPKEEIPAPAPAPSNVGQQIVDYAKQYLGYKYVSGGSSPEKGFDCSGFTQYVYKHFGVTINRTSKAQINNGVAVSKSNLQPGDLVVFNGDSNTSIGHVGIYIGNDNFIHASNPSDGVKITSLSSSYYKSRYVGARRVI